MHKYFIAIFVIGSILKVTNAQDYRAEICDKLVKMGVTYLTSKQLQAVAKCMEKTMIDIMPYDGTDATNNKIYNALLGCLTSNLLTKAADALSKLSKFTQCLKPSSITCLGSKVKDSFMKIVNEPYKAVTEQVVKCKTNKAGESNMAATCADKAYKIAIAYLNKDFIDGTCITLLPKINQAEFTCCKNAITGIMNLSKFTCQNKSGKCQAGTTPTCPAP